MGAAVWLSMSCLTILVVHAFLGMQMCFCKRLIVGQQMLESLSGSAFEGGVAKQKVHRGEAHAGLTAPQTYEPDSASAPS